MVSLLFFPPVLLSLFKTGCGQPAGSHLSAALNSISGFLYTGGVAQLSFDRWHSRWLYMWFKTMFDISPAVH